MVHPADDESDDDLYGPFSSGHIPHSLAHEVESDPEPDEEDFPSNIAESAADSLSPLIQVVQTRQLREHLGTGAAAADKVAAVLHYMNSVGLNLTLFLDLVSWGDEECVTHPKIRCEQTGLMVSKELPSILSRWHQPPHAQTSTNRQAQGAKSHLERFTFACVRSVIMKELDGICDILRCPAEDLSLDELTSANHLVSVHDCAVDYNESQWSQCDR